MANLATITTNILADSGIDDINVVVTTGSYSNPAWITALSWTKITDRPTTLAGYGITDAVPSSRTITINGTAQDLSANRTFNVGTVTSVAALTLGTTGTDLSSSVANGTTTPVITLNVPTASASNRGALSAADWTTFNNKQNALTNPVTGTGTAGQVAYWSSGSAITGESNLFWDATNDRLGIGIATPQRRLDIFTNANSATEYQLSLRNGAGANNVSTGIAFGFNSQSLDPDYLSAISSIITNRTTRAADLTFLTASTGTLVEQMRLNSSGNLGLGVTPSAWFSGVTALQFGSAGVLWSNSDRANLASNVFIDAATNTKYIVNGFALRYAQESGQHYWSVAPSGTAGNNISFTQAMTLNASGNVQIGTTSTQSGTRLLVAGVTDIWSRANTLLRLNHDGTRSVIESFTDGGYSPISISPNGGNVLIGTSTDNGAEFQVSGDTSFGGSTSVSGLLYTNLGTGLIVGGTGFAFAPSSGRGSVQIVGSGDRVLAFGSNGAQDAYIYSASSITQIVTTPSFYLVVGGSERFNVSSSTGAATFSSSVTATSFTSQGGRGTGFGFRLPDWQIYNTSSGNGFAINNYSNDVLTIASTGAATFSSSVTMGRLSTYANDASPSATTNVGMALFESSSSVQLQMGAIAASPYTFWLQTKQSTNSGATFPLALQPSGSNVLIGTTTDEGFKLDVNGTGRFTGQVDSLTRFYVVATPPATNGGLINVRDTVTATNVTSFAGVFFNSSPGNDYSIGKLTENNVGFLQIRNANNGNELLRINSTGAATFFSSVTATSIIRSGGTSSQFLKADGSVDSNTYVTGGPFLPLTGGTLTGALGGTSASFSSSVTASNFITTSDRRLKSEIKEIKNAISILSKFASYEYVKDGKQDAGFIAQEVKEAIPYSVFENNDDILTMSDRPILAYIHKAILELNERINKLEK
jgi:hypothetical protein